MKKNSIMKLFEALGTPVRGNIREPEGGLAPETAPEPAPEPAPEKASSNGKQPENAAERLGRAMLDAFGGLEGVTEDELVDAVLGEWNPSEGGRAEAEASTLIPAGAAEAEEEGTELLRSPFPAAARTPVPMRTCENTIAPVDYSQMSAKQFADLKRMLRKAAADGKRIRL